MIIACHSLCLSYFIFFTNIRINNFLLEISNMAIKDFYQPTQTGGLFWGKENHSLEVI